MNVCLKELKGMSLIYFVVVCMLASCIEGEIDNINGDDQNNTKKQSKTAFTEIELRGLISNAIPGDTLLISGTIDISNGCIETLKQGTASQNIVIKGVNNGTLNLIAYADAACLKILHDYYKIIDLVIEANSNSKRGVLIQGASHGMALNVEVRNTLNEAFKIRKNSQYWYFERCGVVASGREGQYGEAFYCGDANANWTTGSSPDTTGYITFNQCYAKKPHADGFDFKEGTHHIKVINCSVDFENSEVDPKYGNSGVFSRANYVQVINCVMKNNSKGDRSCFFFQRKEAKDAVLYGISSEIKNTLVENFNKHYYWTDQPDAILYNDYQMLQCAGLKQSGSPKSVKIIDESKFVQMTWDGVGGEVY
jgi:hypothetical protein